MSGELWSCGALLSFFPKCFWTGCWDKRVGQVTMLYDTIARFLSVVSDDKDSSSETWDPAASRWVSFAFIVEIVFIPVGIDGQASGWGFCCPKFCLIQKAFVLESPVVNRTSTDKAQKIRAFQITGLRSKELTDLAVKSELDFRPFSEWNNRSGFMSSLALSIVLMTLWSVSINCFVGRAAPLPGRDSGFACSRVMVTPTSQPFFLPRVRCVSACFCSHPFSH